MMPRIRHALLPLVAALASLFACSEASAPKPTPSIVVSAASINLQAVANAVQPAGSTITVTNGGTGTLDGVGVGVTYPTGQPTGWLTTNVSGTTAPSTVTLSASPVGLAPGTYTANVAISAPGAANAPQAVAVTFIVVAAPAIALSASSVQFSASAGGANPGASTVQITNSGSGTLGGLAASGTSNSPQSVNVTFTVGQQPAIALSATSAGFQAAQNGANPPSQTVDVTNVGGGTLTGLAASVSYASGQPAGWLSASLSGTTAPATLTLSATTDALAPGTYTATISVSATGASNSPRTIDVTFTVSPQATIVLSSATADFSGIGGSNPQPQSVNVTSGGGTLSGL